MKNFSINFNTKRKRQNFAKPETFLRHVEELGESEIKYLGWSDGYNACGYSLNDRDLLPRDRGYWVRVAKAVIRFSRTLSPD